MSKEESFVSKIGSLGSKSGGVVLGVTQSPRGFEVSWVGYSCL